MEPKLAVHKNISIDYMVGFYFIFFCYTAILIPLLELYKTVLLAASFNYLNLGLSWFIMFYAMGRLSLLMMGATRRLIELFFWIFVYIWMGYVPFQQVLTESFPLSGTYSSDDIRFALFVVIAGILSFDLGGFLHNSLNKRRERKADDDERSNINLFEIDKIQVNEKKFIVFTLIALFICAIIILKIGGVSALFLNRQIFNAQFGGKIEFLVLSSFLKVSIFVCLVLGVIYYKHSKIKLSLGTKLWIFFIGIVNFMINNPISGARYWIGSMLLTLCFLLLPWGKRSFYKWVITLLCLLLFIFPKSDMFRHTTDTEKIVQSLTTQSNMATDGDYDAFQMTLNTVKYVDLFGHTYGEQLLVAFLFWVPRFIWADKPFGSGTTVADALGYDFTNLSCPLWAEFYIDFGLPGVVLLFILYGYFTQKAQKAYERTVTSNEISLARLCVPYYAPFQIFLLRGELMSGTSYLTAYLFFVLIGYWFFKQKQKPLNQAYPDFKSVSS